VTPRGLCDGCEAGAVQRAVTTIRLALLTPDLPEQGICEGCGCWVFLDEVCPGCKARRLTTTTLEVA
jgi:hypothetical protein